MKKKIPSSELKERKEFLKVNDDKTIGCNVPNTGLVTGFGVKNGKLYASIADYSSEGYNHEGYEDDPEYHDDVDTRELTQIYK